MSLDVTLCTRWRRALTSLSTLSLLYLCRHSFCLCSKLLALLRLESTSTSYILTPLVSLTLLARTSCTKLLNLLCEYSR